MLITTAHLSALHELAAREAAGHPLHGLAENDPQEHIYRELELQGLVVLEPPRAYRLAYAGREAIRFEEAMREAALLPPHDQFKKDWRFLGSDIVAALYAAQQKRGEVGPLTEQELKARGLTENAYDTVEKRPFVRLNQYGTAWEDFARRHRPRLEVHADLANSIRHMHPSYTLRPDLRGPAEHISLLEVMDLLTWSVPERTTYALTKLGQAVYEALVKEGYPTLDTVLDEPIMKTLALLIDEGSQALTSEQLVDLQWLGYVEPDGTVSAAGQAAMRAYSLLQHEGPEQVCTLAITEAEGELLATIQQLTESANDSQLRPDKKTLHRVLIDRMVKRYQELVGRYGRTLRERSAKKRKAVELLEQMKKHDEWFGTFWDIDELLVSLESFSLLRAETEENSTVYRLTPDGQKIVEEQAGHPCDIMATAVKVLTSAMTRFHTATDSWVELAREEELVGTKGGVSKSGRLYADLAEHCVRKPALTREEAELLKKLPHTVDATLTSAGREYISIEEENKSWAFEKLEARGLIERLVDGHTMRTEAGQLLARAVSSAMHLGHPVTPTIVRLLEAIRQVGTLYVKERKIRITPQNWAEVERLTGLGPQEFKEVRHVARIGQYIGEVAITEAGLELLEVLDQLNSKTA